jgi:hypothetical protein
MFTGLLELLSLRAYIYVNTTANSSFMKKIHVNI